ncbi:MAG TPA: PAS domain S-box protein [Catenuloplanes sp.]|jgi:protein-histidine pros-kinase
MAVTPILADPEPEAGAYPHSLLEAIPDPSAVVDTNGVIVAVNRHLVALIGRGSDELVGSPLRDCFADEALVDSHLRQGFAVGSVANHELALRSDGGPRTVVTCDASTINSGPSAPDRLLVVARDGAEQARASVLAALVQSADDAIVGMTLEDVITSWNSGAERLYGYAASEVVGRGFDVVVPEGARAAEARILQRVSAGERVEPYEAERVGKDGTPVTVSVAISPIIDPDGRLVGIASMSRDLREARIAETRLRWMLEVAPDAIMGVDASGYIELVNAQCERLFGYQREELLGQPVEKVIPDGLRPVDAGQVAAGHELTTLHKDGSQVSVEISLSALETPGGRLTMAAVRDITDRKRIERQLREQNIALMLASQSKDNFLASMSHELRTPLNAIIGFTGTVLMRLPGPLNAEQEHQLRLVQTSGRHLLAIINDLLDLAKIESGRVQINRDLVDCRDLADEVVQSLQPLADGKGITLRIEAPEDGSAVAIADRRALGQILINLINNAIKFTDTGEVRVCLIPHPAPGEALRIVVHDTGPGILAADLSRVFHAFERSAATAKASEEGTGLGLHISQRLAELLGATITVSSVVGEGSTFAITLVEQ